VASDTGLVLVAGLTRCGTSLLLQMLHAGGFPIVPGHMGAPAFEHPANVGGPALPAGAAGAVKWLDPQEHTPPPAVLSVFLRRDHRQQAKSMAKFLARMDRIPVSRSQRFVLEASLRHDEPRALRALRDAGPVFTTSFESLLASPAVILPCIAELAGHPIDFERALAVMKPRGPRCLPFLLEEQLLSEAAEEGRVQP